LSEGWKPSDTEWLAYLLAKVEKDILTQEDVDLMLIKPSTPNYIEPPMTISLTQHLRDDLFALKEFFNINTPPEVQARRHSVQLLLYGFADASG
jgi:hypothetical protein